MAALLALKTIKMVSSTISTKMIPELLPFEMLKLSTSKKPDFKAFKTLLVCIILLTDSARAGSDTPDPGVALHIVDTTAKVLTGVSNGPYKGRDHRYSRIL